MPRGGLSVLFLVVVTFGFSGCAVMQPLRPVARYAKNLLTFRGTDYSNPADEEDQAWVRSAGDEAHEFRGGGPMEYDPDPWYQKYIMSEKARSIERNVGIGFKD